MPVLLQPPQVVSLLSLRWSALFTGQQTCPDLCVCTTFDAEVDNTCCFVHLCHKEVVVVCSFGHLGHASCDSIAWGFVTTQPIICCLQAVCAPVCSRPHVVPLVVVGGFDLKRLVFWLFLSAPCPAALDFCGRRERAP